MSTIAAILLIIAQQFTFSTSTILPESEYPGHVGGRCTNGFDCDPGGDLICVPFTALRDCIQDCPNGTDEECSRSLVLCDEKTKRGCGKCVQEDQLNVQCTDRRWRKLCSEVDHIKCKETQNCVLPRWIGDGVDDCADGSDEDPCMLGQIDCEFSNQTEEQSFFGPTNIVERSKGKCVKGEFQCLSSHECIPIAYIFDGVEQCSDGSDEKYCTDFMDIEMCQQQQQCSFSPHLSIFTCGCPMGYKRSTSGLCLSILAPNHISDCADLRRRYQTTTSGIYILEDWSCSHPEMCKFSAHCEMDLFDGGWTVIMQRSNTSLDFDKDFISYENGFEIDLSNFWIGLERMYRLTNRPNYPNELLLRLRASADGKILLIRYSLFTVCERRLNYRLNIGHLVLASGLYAVDEMAASSMCPFTTSAEKGCNEGGGWWRRKCLQKGVLTVNNRAQDEHNGLTWNGIRLSAVQMLIRPRGYVPPLEKFL